MKIRSSTYKCDCCLHHRKASDCKFYILRKGNGKALVYCKHRICLYLTSKMFKQFSVSKKEYDKYIELRKIL